MNMKKYIVCALLATTCCTVNAESGANAVLSSYLGYSYNWNKPYVRHPFFEAAPEQLEGEIRNAYGIPSHVKNIPVLMEILKKRYYGQPVSEELWQKLLKESATFRDKYNKLGAQARRQPELFSLYSSLNALSFLYSSAEYTAKSEIAKYHSGF